MESYQKGVGGFPELLVDALDVVEAAVALVANEAAVGGLRDVVLEAGSEMFMICPNVKKN